jgi:hypothetical protein
MMRQGRGQEMTYRRTGAELTPNAPLWLQIICSPRLFGAF